MKNDHLYSKILEKWFYNDNEKVVRLNDIIEIFEEESIEEVTEPIGNFVLNWDLTHKPIIKEDGHYYHYSDVCNMLNKVKEDKKEGVSISKILIEKEDNNFLEDSMGLIG
ncbi:MAG: hypothetical protein WC346_17630 [Methanogenium sp.]|jgi:hypothetical protein